MGIKISELPQTSQLTENDVLPIVQSGDTKKIQAKNIITNSHNSNQTVTYSSDYINNNFNKVDVKNTETQSTTDTYSCDYIDNKIVDYYDGDTNQAYSCNYINNQFERITEYSTTEKRIGSWIDGKPLYRKVLSQNNKTEIDINSLDYDYINIVSTIITIASSPKDYVRNPYFTSSADYFRTLIVPSGALKIETSHSTIKNWTTVIEYTKVND